MTTPKRGFTKSEYETRLLRAQEAMNRAGMDGLVVTTPQNVRYFSGFATQFWESPTRPWFLVVPREGLPIAVIPEIGAPAMAETWITDIRTWPAPQPQDDGISLLKSVLEDLPRRSGGIGWEMGREQTIRMPIRDFDTLRESVTGLDFIDGSPLIWSLRVIKSAAEIAHIRHICHIASNAFEVLNGAVKAGDSELDAARKFRLALLYGGADSVPFAATVSGPGGYDQIIVGPGERVLGEGDVLFIDTGTVFDGYFCDFDRNYAIGSVADETARAHDLVWRATEAGIAAARPGATTTDLWRAMANVLEEAGPQDLNVGRMGHGLGMQLTEPPSNMPGDDTELRPGMVMTIEPGVVFAPGKMLVHEENVAITEDGCALLTRRAPREMWTIGT